MSESLFFKRRLGCWIFILYFKVTNNIELKHPRVHGRSDVNICYRLLIAVRISSFIDRMKD